MIQDPITVMQEKHLKDARPFQISQHIFTTFVILVRDKGQWKANSSE